MIISVMFCLAALVTFADKVGSSANCYAVGYEPAIRALRHFLVFPEAL